MPSCTRPVRQSYPGQHLPNRGVEFFFIHPCHAQRQSDIVERGKVRHQPEILEHHANPPTEARQPLSGERHHIFAEHADKPPAGRSEEHTSELQSLMRISYAVFCLKKKQNKHTPQDKRTSTETNY